MVACARRKLLGGARKAVFHCSTRCVRRAFLCGRDRLTGKDFSHRRDWIIERQKQFARLFAIEIAFHAVMSNHLHLVLRTRPRVAKRWSKLEVARRWLTLTHLAKCMSDEVPEPDPKKIEQLAKDKKKIAKLRKRLCNISWMMGLLCENIARRANKEDACLGRFWETRFRCRECTSESALLLCGIYVDLNPIKAGEADRPEQARYTSIYQRLQARRQRKDAKNRTDAHLGELTWDPRTERDDRVIFSSRTGRRASDLGLLSIRLEVYCKLLKWTARMLKSGRRKTIPKDLESVLEQLDVDHDAWLETLDEYDASFCHAVGPAADLETVCQRMEVSNLKGTSAARRIFR